MDLMTTCSNAARQAVFDRNKQYGNDLVWVRTNATAREKCYPWQGKVISMDGNGRTVTDRNGNRVEAVPVSDTSYGEPDGLWGINCHHVPPNVFIPGASLVQGAEYMPDPEENARRYALTQEQRKLKKDVRYAKREAAMMDAAGNKEGFEEAAFKVKNANANLSGFLNEHSDVLAENREMVSTLGYNRSVSRKVRSVTERYTKYRHHEDGTIVVTDDMKGNPDYHTPQKYRPFAVVETTSSKKVPQIDRTYYDKDGIIYLQINGGAHSARNTDYDNNGAHAHDFVNGKRIKYQNTNPKTMKKRPFLDGRNLTDAEIAENKDIIPTDGANSLFNSAET